MSGLHRPSFTPLEPDALGVVVGSLVHMSFGVGIVCGTSWLESLSEEDEVYWTWLVFLQDGSIVRAGYRYFSEDTAKKVIVP